MVMGGADGVVLCWVGAESNCFLLHTCEGKKKNEFSPSQQSRGLFFIFLQSAEKNIAQGICPTV